MAERRRTQILLHGAIVLLVGLLCGIPFGVGVGRAWSEEAVRAWRVAHSEGVTVGLMLIVVAAVSDRLRLDNGAATVLF
ncbi:MAG: hypothetical protein HY675_03555 [Chloroflexi bacterium]|nr:hypothetical protein [Chloroflexota bacterium]